MKIHTFIIRTPAIILLFVLFGCGRSNDELRAEQQALDSDQAQLSSCSHESVLRVGISTLSAQETSTICVEMTTVLNQRPSVKLLREVSRAANALKHSGHGDDLNENAYQFMRIAQLRGQVNDEDAMIATFNLAYKIVTGMKGGLTLKDLSFYLSKLGSNRARALTDDALIYDAAAISVMRRDQGY